MGNEYKDILLGKKLGEGCYRNVYQCKLGYNLVVKVEKDEYDFHNIKEWNIWKEIEYADICKWFAPCYHISPNGKILIQEKVEFSRRKDYPEKIPSFFTDIQLANFGFIKDRFVCSDYGSTVVTGSFSENKMKKTDWNLGETRN